MVIFVPTAPFEINTQYHYIFNETLTQFIRVNIIILIYVYVGRHGTSIGDKCPWRETIIIYHSTR